MKFNLAPGLTIDTEDDRVQKKGLRFAVIAASGGGKSHLIALVAEQAKQQGAQIVLFDTHGEYWTFGETFPDVLVVGGDNADLPLSEDAIDVYAEAYSKGKSFDFSFKEVFTDDEVYNRIVEKLLRALWKIQVNEPRPALWIIEEAQFITPQEKSFDVMRKVSLVKSIATGGRKFGLAFGLSTQRPAEIHKTPLSQCWVRFFGQLDEPLDQKAVAPLMKPLNADKLAKLSTGQFYVYGWPKNPELYNIEPKRVTRDAGKTIQLRPIERKPGDQLSISQFRQLIESKLRKASEEKGEIAVLKGKLSAQANLIESLERKADVAEVIRESLTLAVPAREGKVESASVSPELMGRLEKLATLEAEKLEAEKRVQNYAARLKFVQDAVLQFREGLQFFLGGDLQVMTNAEKFESVAGPPKEPLSREELLEGTPTIIPTEPTSDDLEEWQRLWMGKLREAPRKILKFLIEHKGKEFDQQQLAILTGYKTGGNFYSALATLRKSKLIRESADKKVRLA